MREQFRIALITFVSAVLISFGTLCVAAVNFGFENNYLFLVAGVFFVWIGLIMVKTV